MSSNYDIVCAENTSLEEARFNRTFNVDPVFKVLGRELSTDDRGVLQVDLSLVEALWIVKVFRKLRIDAIPVRKKSLDSFISFDSAKRITEEYLAQIKIRRPSLGLMQVVERELPWPLSKLAYGFFSASEEMRAEGASPPGMTICIDRFTGTVMDERMLLEIELMQMLTE